MKVWWSHNWQTLAVLTAVVVLGAVAYFVVFREEEQRYTVNVSLLLHANLASSELGRPCAGSGGYSDIRPGAPVTAKDRDGKVVSSGFLGPGRVLPRGTGSGGDCLFEAMLTNVPERPRYSFEVSRRGQLNYTLDELKSQGWTVDFVLGANQ